MFSSQGVATGAGSQVPRGLPYSVDSKAMRKVEDGSDISIVAEFDSASGAGAILFFGGRILVKAH